MPIAIHNTKPLEKAKEPKNTEKQAEAKAPAKKAGRPKKNA